ncbi:MAG: hypothetical protein PHX15_02385 [Candidatus Nanoarchaeia archaeon]|jgi:hypothetical protein|nr:hypothetical protein [Candidatus Nanoarchaeia archaeon]MDD3994021.1 hypothetical protein [Candidatus Nanoarchaeia archaeon]MDD4563511.1 hypothetical protein [Candidatus Nanoarchaeia archaeon]
MKEQFWHKVSDEEKEKISIQTKELLNNFSKKLEKINNEERHFSSKLNPEGFREEGKPWKTDLDFKEISLLNAPFVEENFIKAEKANWN